MEWAKGYTATYDLYQISPVTWADIQQLEFTGGSIDRSSKDLLQSADIDMTEKPNDGEIWVRIYLNARQNGDAERIPLFTGLTSAPERELDGRRESYKIECYSVLKPLDDIMLQRGWYAPAGIEGAKLVSDLLKGFAPVTYSSGSQTISESIIAEDGETKLSMAQKILNAIGWHIVIDGMGDISIEPYDTANKAMFSTLQNDIVETDITDTYDWYSCPNVFRAVASTSTATARDDSEKSPLSTVNRGREIWAEETGVNLADNETLSQYAKRRLTELQTPSRTLSYKRRYVPELNVGDMVRISYPEVGLDGKFKITEQSIELGYACQTKEEVIEVG